MKLLIEEIKNCKKKYDNESNLSFGTIFTDRMFSMKYENGEWDNAKIHKFEDFSMNPAALVLHYSQTIFEGMKAFKSKEDKILLFRPEKNFERMNKSAERMVMPKIDTAFVLDALKKLLRLEKDWIPKTKGTSLYIRPTMIATDNTLGLKVSETYLFYIILTPVGSIFSKGFKPIKLYIPNEYVRAVKGGVGAAKTGGNYAASLYAMKIAKNMGYDQVLWLDAIEKKYVEEGSGMNVFFRFKDKVVTPLNEGTILEGITRDSVMQIVKKYGIEMKEERININEIVESIKNGNLLEMFFTGTAAIITPIGQINYMGTNYTINENKTGELTEKIYNDLMAYQYGIREDDMGWIKVI